MWSIQEKRFQRKCGRFHWINYVAPESCEQNCLEKILAENRRCRQQEQYGIGLLADYRNDLDTGGQITKIADFRNITSGARDHNLVGAIMSNVYIQLPYKQWQNYVRGGTRTADWAPMNCPQNICLSCRWPVANRITFGKLDRGNITAQSGWRIGQGMCLGVIRIVS